MLKDRKDGGTSKRHKTLKSTSRQRETENAAEKYLQAEGDGKRHTLLSPLDLKKERRKDDCLKFRRGQEPEQKHKNNRALYYL